MNSRQDDTYSEGGTACHGYSGFSAGSPSGLRTQFGDGYGLSPGNRSQPSNQLLSTTPMESDPFGGSAWENHPTRAGGPPPQVTQVTRLRTDANAVASGFPDHDTLLDENYPPPRCPRLGSLYSPPGSFPKKAGSDAT